MGPQTVEALVATFDEDYNAARTYSEAVEVDEKYPQDRMACDAP